ncbi:hypothetical protein G6011_11470 [Alternaria panax]|uniref:DUF3669 domain-containing protein n=1 Tax=Alternaria panax TaxID=48097 RepID=A0AAD4IE28_9PLEO|nr:hypothetical protein G6011_11470 [Alternaria panax]
MEEEGLDYVTIAKVLAEALAHCYWKAQVDANDVEFVLARSTISNAVQDRVEGHLPRPVFRIQGQELVIWMLDYDCVHTLSQDMEGITKAAHAFWRNDPYFPQPYAYGQTSHDSELWEIFKTNFLHVSRCMIIEKEEGIMDELKLELPQNWVTLIEAEGSVRAQKAECRYSEGV